MTWLYFRESNIVSVAISAHHSGTGRINAVDILLRVHTENRNRTNFCLCIYKIASYMFISYPSRFDELCQDKTVEFLAGGATQNAMKVAQVSPNGYFEPNYADRIFRMFAIMCIIMLRNALIRSTELRFSNCESLWEVVRQMSVRCFPSCPSMVQCN